MSSGKKYGNKIGVAQGKGDTDQEKKKILVKKYMDV